jgi:hypothetical protein
MSDRRTALVVCATVAVLGTTIAPAQDRPCADCNGDGVSTISDLIVGVSIALGTRPTEACAVFDRDGDNAVEINELIAALDGALDGCTVSATPTPTSTLPVSPTATPDAASVPTEPAALLAWLQAGNYLTWMTESAPHRSAGPHGGRVRTYLNDSLFTSLTQGSAEHPAASAAVKELYFGGSTVGGWAVMVKLADLSDSGRGWYWYEYFGSGAPIAGTGLTLCSNCHSQGQDYLLSPFPLQ